MLVHMALDKQRIFLRIQTAGNILGQLLQRMPPQIRRVLADRNGVHICHKIIAVKLIGKLRPVLNGSQI